MSIKAIYDLKSGLLANDLKNLDTKKNLLDVEIKNKIEKSKISMNSKEAAYINSISAKKDQTRRKSIDNNIKIIENINSSSHGMILYILLI